MKKIFFSIAILLSLVFTSCQNWLDVEPADQTKADVLLSSYSGYYDALNGCYIALKSTNIYGEKLTMTDIESLAQLWDINANSLPAESELMNFNYTGDNAQTEITTIYGGLYNVIVQANMIINHIQNNGEVIPDESIRAAIEAEAYAIRAFCHFDVLRLFGQLPQNATQLVSLPYAENVSVDELPAYYGFDAFVEKIKSDLNKAETLLDGNDAIFTQSFDELNASASSTGLDAFWSYRQERFNYWAVKAIEARLYRYVGDVDNAYATAKTLLNATGADGNALISLSGASDLAQNYFTCPSECLLALNNYSIMDYFATVFGYSASQIKASHHVISSSKLNELFAGQNIASNNRYNQLWSHETTDQNGTIIPSLKKYYYDTSADNDASTLVSKYQVIPLIRLSELYLIAIESTTSLTEANTLWKTYQASHAVLLTEDAFASLDAAKQAVLDEYRREFYAEGQMFYTYKRLGATSMKWRTASVSELDYILPLPNSEFNPN